MRRHQAPRPAPSPDADRVGGVAVRDLLRPGVADAVFDLIRARNLPIVGDGGGIWSWIHVDDAAAATVAAYRSGQRRVQHRRRRPAPVREMLPAIASMIGAQPPRHVPVWLARLLAGEVGVVDADPGARLVQREGPPRTRLDAARSSWRDGLRPDLPRHDRGPDRPVRAVPAPPVLDRVPDAVQRRRRRGRRAGGVSALPPTPTQRSSRRRPTCRPSPPGCASTTCARRGCAARPTSAPGCPSRCSPTRPTRCTPRPTPTRCRWPSCSCSNG